MRDWFTHACNSNQLIILARKEGNLHGRTAAGDVVVCCYCAVWKTKMKMTMEGGRLLTVENPTCCSMWCGCPGVACCCCYQREACGAGLVEDAALVRTKTAG
jgi:hypothetical protein